MSKNPTDTEKIPAVFTEMLRSFVILGETQNLSHTVDSLGITRQTVRRHIRKLEQLKGFSLFEPSDRRYQLTADGISALADAQDLLMQSSAWLNNSTSTSKGMHNVEIEINNKSWLYAQRHPLIQLWKLAPPILQRGYEAWFESRGILEHAALESIRPFMLVYRKYRDEWLLVEVGEKSAYATWLGAPLAKSEIGRRVELGDEYGAAVDHWRFPYDAVTTSGDLWFEHISISVPREFGGPPVPVNYQRLIASCKFPDGQPAIMVFGARTDRIIIPNMPESRFIANNPENLMEFEV